MSRHAELIARLREFAKDLSQYQDTYAPESQMMDEAADALERGDTEPRAAFEAGYRAGGEDTHPQWFTTDGMADAFTRYQQSRTGEQP